MILICWGWRCRGTSCTSAASADWLEDAELNTVTLTASGLISKLLCNELIHSDFPVFFHSYYPASLSSTGLIYITANLFLWQAAAWSLLGSMRADLNPESGARKKHSAGYAGEKRSIISLTLIMFQTKTLMVQSIIQPVISLLVSLKCFSFNRALPEAS